MEALYSCKTTSNTNNTAYYIYERTALHIFFRITEAISTLVCLED